MTIKELFKIEAAPRRGLLPLEWVVLGYMAFTLLMVLFLFTRLDNPDSMIWDRLKIGAVTLALWASYRLLPCRMVMLFRVMAQFGLLAWWYPDTYELNRVLPNLDHYFALADQWLFGCQPALLFAERFPSPVVSELMDMGYAAYYPLIVLTVLYFFFWRYQDFQRAAFVVIGSFFAYYVVFDLLPVVGPTFYYKAVGLKEIANGVFPNLHDYFNNHQACLPSPGYKDGLFYHLVEDAKAAGERPTAAFPSSHVGISTVCMLLIGWSGNRKLLLAMAPFYVFLCLATVYIQAHYAVDAIAGLITGAMAFFGFMAVGKIKA
ncbi:phosphatase PAP2 family protein [Prevotella sp.]|uniref:phosphatase PAP2 family protein n=1 Tax=Prevotella sp. TaxID=59823 RepID=UPI002F9599D1